MIAGNPRITPFLWFETNAEEAVEFYLSIFPNSRRTGELRNPGTAPGPAGSIMTVRFELGGLPFIALNGCTKEAFNNSVSFVVNCASQQEIDFYWERLLAGGGSEIACGWLMDKFGLRWQVVPENIQELVSSAGAMTAMMGMKKLDIAALESAQ